MSCGARRAWLLQAGISAGDTVIYTSSFFGEELWPSDAVI
jgi:hypothetical protein